MMRRWPYEGDSSQAIHNTTKRARRQRLEGLPWAACLALMKEHGEEEQFNKQSLDS